MPAVEILMALPSRRREQRVEERAGYGDQLRSGLIGLLIAQEVCRLLVEVHAGKTVTRVHGFLMHDFLRIAARLGLPRDDADTADEPVRCVRQRRRAAVEGFGAERIDQRLGVAIVASTA